MKKTVITLVAVIFLAAGAAQAALEIEVTANDDPALGLKSFTVTAKSTAGEIINSFQDIFICSDATATTPGYVHHVWPTSGTVKTPTVDDWAESMFVDPAWAAYDTYMLIPAANIILNLGAPLDETNDFSNPTGLALIKVLAPECGMGNYGHPIGDPSIFSVDPETAGMSIDLLQVVYPAGMEGSVWVHALLFADGGTVDEEIVAEVVPEPMTMTLLAIGGLALIRRRRA